MAVVGKPVDPWHQGKYVFGDEGQLLGRAASVRGLDAALEVGTGRGGFPDISVDGMDQELERWTGERAKTPGVKWNFVIRDNVKGRWVRIKGAFIHRRNMMQPSCVWAINGAELGDGPS